ncbi:MAG: CaiB/BaiF CoA-transferase family protein [Desulfobacterales bacterium]
MGPLKGVRLVEFAGIGPGPFCAMMLSDMGADIIRVDRKSTSPDMGGAKYNILNRGRPSIGLDLKTPEGKEAAFKLIDQADGLFEGFRPQVMERLGLGPDLCLERNPKLVFGRMTGWGQDGPLAPVAGHDINYISLTGALHAIGPGDGKPSVPLNLIGDFGGGGMMLAFGMVCALFEARQSGKGQVIDAAMVDGAAALMASVYGGWNSGGWVDQRGSNVLDGGAHFYNAYETSDGKYISIGSIEPQFYALLLKHAEIDDPEFQAQMDRSKWPAFKETLTTLFKTKTRDEWCDIMLGTDICFAPVLSLEEAVKYPHNVERETFVEIDGVIHQAPAPRFSRTSPEIQGSAPAQGSQTEPALKDWGFSSEDIETLRVAGAI